MATPVVQPSFAAGELSPFLYARVDLAKYHVGLAKARNFYVDYRGGVSTRPGTEYLAQAKSPGNVRLIPFQVSTLATYMIEVGANYLRFYSNGEQVVELPTTITGITRANPAVVTSVAHPYIDDEEVVIQNVLGMVEVNGQNFMVDAIDADHYSLKTLEGTPYSSLPNHPYISGGTASRIYTLATPYGSESLLQIKYVQSADVLTLTHPNHSVHNLTRTSPSTFVLQEQTVGPKISAPQNVVATAGTAGDFKYGYVVTAVDNNTGEESLASGVNTVDSDILDQTDDTLAVSISFDPVDFDAYYNVYKWGPIPKTYPQPTIFGFIGRTSITDFTDANYGPDFSRVPPILKNPFEPGQITNVEIVVPGFGLAMDTRVSLVITGPGTDAAGYCTTNSIGKAIAVTMTNKGVGYDDTTTITAPGSILDASFSYDLIEGNANYPLCCTYFQQRRVFGGQNSAPETIIMSQTGHYQNFDTTPVSLATDAITISLASRSVNAIKALVPMSTGLVAFTTGGAFLISGGSANSGVAPDSIVALPQASGGANDVPPLVVNYDILYIQNRGTVVRDLAFNYYLQSYQGTDVSILANHLFEGNLITSWAYAEEPHKIIYAVLDSGGLLSLTFVPEQEITAWTPNDTRGLFRAVSTVPEGPRDAVYLVVKRLVGGIWKNFIERLTSGVFAAVEDSWCVDAGVRYPLAYPAAILTVSQSTGTTLATASVPVFTIDDVGKVIWCGGGRLHIDSFLFDRQVQCTVQHPITQVIPDDPSNTPVPFNPDEWSMVQATHRVTGLNHLIGMEVTGLVDGSVIAPTVVDAQGGVTLPNQGSKIVVGLAYTAQFQSLYLDVGEPTIQSKRKSITALTVRMTKARGLKVGTDFADLVEMKELPAVDYTPPIGLYTGDRRVILPGGFNTTGQVCIQQDYPLPATVLGIIPEVKVGDTAR